MIHPESGNIGLASEEQFTVLYVPRGWERVEVDLAAASVLLGGPVTSIDDLEPEQIKRAVLAQIEAKKVKDRSDDEKATLAAAKHAAKAAEKPESKAAEKPEA